MTNITSPGTTNYWSAFYHMTCTAPEATNAKSLDAYFFLSLLLTFVYSFLFRYLFKGFFLPCFFNETFIFLFSVIYNFLL